MVNWTACFHKFDGLIPSFMREILTLVYFLKKGKYFQSSEDIFKTKNTLTFLVTVLLKS